MVNQANYAEIPQPASARPARTFSLKQALLGAFAVIALAFAVSTTVSAAVSLVRGPSSSPRLSASHLAATYDLGGFSAWPIAGRRDARAAAPLPVLANGPPLPLSLPQALPRDAVHPAFVHASASSFSPARHYQHLFHAGAQLQRQSFMPVRPPPYAPVAAAAAALPAAPVRGANVALASQPALAAAAHAFKPIETCQYSSRGACVQPIHAEPGAIVLAKRLCGAGKAASKCECFGVRIAKTAVKPQVVSSVLTAQGVCACMFKNYEVAGASAWGMVLGCQ